MARPASAGFFITQRSALSARTRAVLQSRWLQLQPYRRPPSLHSNTSSIMRALITAAILLLSPAQARQVTATVYDGWYHGRTTYCGGTYRHWDVSAAHPWLPCGTRVTVQHRGRLLTVPVTDRCDCGSLDLSAGAAYRLGVPLDGTATVSIRY
jgi:rare lipoprotein A (peptidoglycan hydrolase)